MVEVIRIRGVARPLFPAKASKDAGKTAARSDFLERLGIEGALAKWLVENLSNEQFGAFESFMRSRKPDVSAKAARRRRKPSPAVVAACARALEKMPHVQAAKLGLSTREIQKCNARGIDPAKYAAVKAQSGGAR